MTAPHPRRAEAVAALLGLIVGAAEELGGTPVEVLETETGGRACLKALGVTDDELAVADRRVAEL